MDSSTRSGTKANFWNEQFQQRKKEEELKELEEEEEELLEFKLFDKLLFEKKRKLLKLKEFLKEFREFEKEFKEERKEEFFFFRQKKLQQHNDPLRTKIDHYIQNNLPIRLIEISTMALVDRAKLQEQIGRKITKGSFICDANDCLCFERVKDEFKYSILSHRWGFPELAFSEFGKLHEKVTQDSPPSLKAIISRSQQLWKGTPFEPSLDKLLAFQKVSAQKQCNYAWVDTICINKESSAELDESIRSMYAWYKDSHICIVHLGQTHYSLDMKRDPWFTRGWTLQELLAPKSIKFFSSSWEEITDRENDKDLSSAEQQAAKEGQDQPPLWSTIHQITNIPIDDLLDFKPGLYDIGKRMGWASKRQTTRVEDMAYCLIGIFRVNLSTAYGEKEGAFYRLQVEIMQNSDDQSLFDWRGPASGYNSMFAASPECFSRALGLPGNEKAKSPIDANQTSTFSANFKQRISHKLYDKSKVPDLGIWDDHKATAFIVLGQASPPEESVLMLLNQLGDDRHYERLDVIKTRIDPEELPEESMREITIK